jgi:signal transduction histidine kinase
MSATSKVSWQTESRHRVMHAAGYVTVVGVVAGEIFEMPFGARLIVTLGLLALFTVGLALVLEAVYVKHRMAPFIVFAAIEGAIGIAIMYAGAEPIYGAVVFFVLCTIVSMRLPLPLALIWVVSPIAALCLIYVSRGAHNWLPSVLSLGAGYFAFSSFSLAFRQSIDARVESQRLLVQLTDAQERLRDLAVLEERQRLAREMHDAVGHRLTVATVLLEGAGRLIPTDPGRAARMVETSRDQVKEGLADLRTAVSALRTEEASGKSTPEVLRALVDVYSQAADAEVTLEIQAAMPEPDPERKLVVIRTAQEALTNVQKHAGASRIELAFRQEGNAFVFTCRDDGRGLSGAGNGALASDGQAGAGFGLRNLRERAARFAGRVDLEARSTGGAELRLTLPAGLGGAHDG